MTFLTHIDSTRNINRFYVVQVMPGQRIIKRRLQRGYTARLSPAVRQYGVLQCA
jgi:hypothetical protein